MSYIDRINELISGIAPTFIDFNTPRTRARKPTQVSSNFITNREQGDWAEELVFNAIDENPTGLKAIKYGKSDSLIAGDLGFDELFDEFQRELDQIGKRPDILIFKLDDYDPDMGEDISNMPFEETSDYVKKAIAGIEVRSSAYLHHRYEESILADKSKCINDILNTKEYILQTYAEELSQTARVQYKSILENLNEYTMYSTDFRVPTWRSSQRLIDLKRQLSTLKQLLRTLQKRDFLSITPKVEDLKVVNQWIKTFEVPHYYFQVFFDKVYGISYENILNLLSSPEKEGVDFFIESDVKNQNKATIKINTAIATLLAERVDEPSHESVRLEMARGRLLFFVTFKEGKAYFDFGELSKLLGI